MMTYKELAKKLRSLGCEEIPRRGKGSHRKWKNPSTGKTTIVPDWGNKDLKKGTVYSILKQLGINWKEFFE